MWRVRIKKGRVVIIHDKNLEKTAIWSKVEGMKLCVESREIIEATNRHVEPVS